MQSKLNKNVEYNAFENDSWVLRLVEYVQHALKHPHVRIIGVCYGHQIVARALGAQVVQNDRGGWEASVSEVQQTAKGKLLFGNKDVVVRPFNTHFLLCHSLKL